MVSTAKIKKFLSQYEEATNSHVFANVNPLIHPKARYLFTDGTFIGRAEIGKAFEKTWEKIKEETYGIRDVQIIAQDERFAVVSYVFTWRGKVKGKICSGKGRGTNVLCSSKAGLQCVYEHLSA